VGSDTLSNSPETGKAYIARFEIPEDTPDVYGKGYCIHPGILDSITQIGFCSFMNMTNKTFDFNGTFLPVLETLLISARTNTKRFVSRVLDLDSSSSVARVVDAKLSSLLATHRFAVDYFAAGVDAEAADAKVNALKYPHGRSTIIDTATFADQSVPIRDATCVFGTCVW
jgi:hypothetical protein